MQILHTSLSENEIIEAVKEKLTAPMGYSMDEGDGTGDYVYSDITIDEVKQ